MVEIVALFVRAVCLRHYTRVPQLEMAGRLKPPWCKSGLSESEAGCMSALSTHYITSNGRTLISYCHVIE
jgi:hypothetical protein